MASGDPVVKILQVMPPQANAPTPDVRAGGSTPAEALDVWDFDAAGIEYLDYLCLLEGYGSGGLTFTLPWTSSSATANEARLGIAIRRLDTAEDLDSAHTYDFNEVDSTAPSSDGKFVYPTIAFTDGADMDNWANGELAIVRVRRNATHANDDMTGDAELLPFTAKET